MAESYSHKFGQIIGDLLEVAIKPFLDEFAQRHRLFLDVKGNRELRGKGKKLTWVDKYGNSHDLDFVLERGGSTKTQGEPVAFIEAAWRRYTKHSRNKAQEIQGAILPLVEHHERSVAFKGVILAGVFTDGALNQLLSSGFSVLYFTYETVIEAFAAFDIDASSHEKTSEADFKKKVTDFYNLPDPSAVANELVALNRERVDVFLQELEKAVKRRVDHIHVLPLYGNANVLNSIKEAIDFVEAYNEATGSNEFTRYEIIVRFNNRSEIIGKLESKAEALEFLAIYA